MRRLKTAQQHRPTRPTADCSRPHFRPGPNNVNVVVGQYYSAGPPPAKTAAKGLVVSSRHVVTSPSLTVTALCDGTVSNNGHFSETLAVENAQTPRPIPRPAFVAFPSPCGFFENRSKGVYLEHAPIAHNNLYTGVLFTARFIKLFLPRRTISYVWKLFYNRRRSSTTKITSITNEPIIAMVLRAFLMLTQRATNLRSEIFLKSNIYRDDNIITQRARNIHDEYVRVYKTPIISH